MRPTLSRFCLALLLLITSATLAQAVIKKLTPLKEVLDAEELIFTATVEKVDPDKPATIFKFGENLKGKAPFERIPVNLVGDAEAQREKQTKIMLERLAPGRKMVIFASKQGKDYSAFVYLEGTWFQMKGTVDADTKAVRWAFLHGEPYFRRTFKGTTAELIEVVKDARSGKKAPPGVDEKEPPGYGPKAETQKPEEPKKPVSQRFRSGPVFAVIPSFVLLGPLAIIAAFFPGLFAKLAIGMTRWRAFLVISSTVSTLAVAYYFLRSYLPDHWLCGPSGFNLLLLLVGGLGLVWSGLRHRYMGGEEPEITLPPSVKDLLSISGVLLALVLLVLATGWLAGQTEAFFPVGYTNAVGQSASGMGQSFTAIAAGVALACLYYFYRFLAHQGLASEPQLCLSGESVALAGLMGFLITTQVLAFQKPVAAKTEEPQSATTREAELKLIYESPDFSEVMSPITITENHLYFGVTKLSGFRQTGGVLCVHRYRKEEVWRFNDDGAMKPVFGQVAVQNGKLYTGEGLHTDSDRRLFCLDATTGKPTWAMPVDTTSHTEGGPAVVDGKVYFSAGEDGLFCVNTTDGKPAWQLKGDVHKLHIDNPVAVQSGKVFAGSGYKTLAVFAVDATSGSILWKTPVPLRSFGAPLVLGDKVLFGLGTGNLSEDLNAESDGTPKEVSPAGLIVCLEAATGKPVWHYELPKSVHTSLVADGRTIYANCKDGTVHAINRQTGQPRWKVSLSGELTTGPVLVQEHGVPLALYAVTQSGMVVSLNPQDGQRRWSKDLRELTAHEVSVVSTPRFAETGLKQVFFGAMLTNRNTGNKSAGVFRITDPALE